MARLNKPEKVERRRKGALARFKIMPDGGAAYEARKQEELANLKAKLE